MTALDAYHAPSRLDRTLFAMYGIPWLGHGRTSEFVLILGVAVYVLLFLGITDASTRGQFNSEVFWQGHGALLIYPVIVKGTVTGLGLLGNIEGWSISRGLRFVGGCLGCCIWFAYGTFYVAIGAAPSWGFVWCVTAFWISSRIIVLARADLPPPGAPGNMR